MLVKNDVLLKDATDYKSVTKLSWIANPALRPFPFRGRGRGGLAQFFHLYQVMNLFNHATNLRRSFYFY
jgi:hypothetical protein